MKKVKYAFFKKAFVIVCVLLLVISVLPINQSFAATIDASMLESISVDKSEATSGDTVNLNVKLKNILGVNYIVAWYTSPISKNTMTVTLNYNGETSSFEGKIPIQPNSESGDYHLSRMTFYFAETTENILESPLFSNSDFTVIGTNNDQLIKSVSVNKKEAIAGEKVKVSMKASYPAGINYIIAWYIMPVSRNTLYVDLNYNPETDSFEGYIPVQDVSEPGEYTLTRLGIYKGGNIIDVQQSDLFPNGNFTVTGTNGKGLLESLQVEKKEVTAGENAKIKLKVTNQEGLRYIIMWYTSPLSYTTKYIYLYYNGNSGLFEGNLWIDTNSELGDYNTNRLTIYGSGVMYDFFDTDPLLMDGTFTVVKDETPPGLPIVDEVTDYSTTVTGKSEPGSSVIIKSDKGPLNTAETDESGNFTATIPTQKAGTVLFISAKDYTGNESEALTIVVKDKTPPVRPTVYSIGDSDNFIKGIVEPFAKVVATNKDGQPLGESYAAEDGEFAIPISKQDQGTEIVVVAVDKSGNQSDSTLVSVKDNTAPSIEVNPVTDQDTGVKGTTEAGASVEAVTGTSKLSATAGESGQFTIKIPQQEAGERISVTASDGENISEPVVVTVKDVTDPIVEGVTDHASYNKDVSISFNEGTATLNGKDYEWGTVVKAEGKYVLVVTDEAGNQTTVTFTIDKTVPKVTNVEDNGVYNKDVTPSFEEGTAILNGQTYKSGTVIKDEGPYTLVVTDAAGNKITIKFTIDKTAPIISGVKNNTYYNTEIKPLFNEGTATLNGTAFNSGTAVRDDGAYTLIVTDAAGNKTSVNFTIDKTAPAVSGIEDDAYYNVNVTPTFNDGAATLNGTSFISGTEIEFEGSYTLVVTDRAGNKTTVKFTIDKTAPVVTGIGNNQTSNRGVTPVFNEGTATLNGENFESGQVIKTDGIYTLVVTDRAGNKTSVMFTIDKTAPKVTGVVNKAYYNKDVKVSFDDGTATLNGKAFVNCSVVKVNGLYTLVVTDQAGNKTTVQFTVDKTAPKVTGVVNNGYYNKDVKVSFNEGTGTLNGKAFKTGIIVKSVGVYTLVVTDKAGNKTNVKFTIDKTAPKVSGISNNAYYNRDVKVTFNEGTAKLNSKAYKSGTVVKSVGVYTLVVTDKAGNKTTVKFTIVKTAPSVPKVSTVKSTSTSVTGTAEAYSVVTVKIGTKVYTAKTDKYRKFKVTIPKQKKKTALYVTAKDRAGNVSKSVKVVVK